MASKQKEKKPIAYIADSLKETEINCTNKKCKYNKNRFLIKGRVKLGEIVICPCCNRSITVSRVWFKRKKMK
jgi:hypothetical protein